MTIVRSAPSSTPGDVTIQRGDQVFLDVLINGSDVATITGAAFKFTVKQRIDDPDSAAVLIKATSGSGIAAAALNGAGAVNGVTVTLTATDTSWFPWPRYSHLFYDLEMIPAGAGPLTVAAGAFLVTPDVSVA